MGLFAKVKDILFEEEEVTEEIPVVKKEVKKEPEVVSRQVKPEVKVEAPHEEVKREVRPEVPQQAQKPKTSFYDDDFDALSERDLFKSDNTSPFFDFDETEFNKNMHNDTRKRQTISKPTNVMEYETRKRTEKRTDYGRYEKTEIRETVERKKFKPSPIISPVYGILNEDYKPEDIKDRTDINNSLNIESVRKKAFEPELEILDEEPKTTYFEEETVTVKVKEPEEQRKEKVKTIDELLEDTADEEIPVIPEEKINIRENNEYNELDDELDELESAPKKAKKEDFDDDDTLENDLFDLIDSMYDDREDGEL